jgi:hypothetical protein
VSGASAGLLRHAKELADWAIEWQGKLAASPRVKRRRLAPWPVSSQRSASGWGSGRSLNRSQAPIGVRCSDWPCIQVPARARNPPTRHARKARSFQANGLRCGASLLLERNLARLRRRLSPRFVTQIDWNLTGTSAGRGDEPVGVRGCGGCRDLRSDGGWRCPLPRAAATPAVALRGVACGAALYGGFVVHWPRSADVWTTVR